jgi:retron-type reverse transcriptase
MFDQVISLENLFVAWREFRRGKRARSDVQVFERHLEDNVFLLHNDLVSGTYCHGPYHRFHIFDPKHRVIHKAAVRDRLVHYAVYRVLYPVFDPSFIFDSYSCRIAKGTHAAVDRLEQFTRQAGRNYTDSCWALKFDIKKFFDSVDHGILMNELGRKLGTATSSSYSLREPVFDSEVAQILGEGSSEPRTALESGRVEQLVSEIVGSYSTSNFVGGGGSFQRTAGLPIGNLTSQLFANVYLDAFDHFIKDELQVKHYIRYTDDAVILSNDSAELRWILPFIEQWLWCERRLLLHPHKVKIRKLSQGIDFLGYITLPHHRILRTKSKRRMFKRVNSQNMPSYVGLLEHCNGRELSIQLSRILASQSPLLF